MGKINTTNYPNRPVSAYQDDDMFVLQDNGGETYTTNVGDVKNLIDSRVELEGVQVNGTDLPITNKKVNVDISGKTDLKVIADPFLDIMGYFKGAYVTYNGKLYEFTQEHQGAWNPSHVREIKAAGRFVRAGNGGYNTGNYSTTEGHATRAEGEASHAEGLYTIANSDNQHVEGKYNIADTDDKYAHIVGNGTSDDARSNALTLDWDGNLRVSGDIADGNGDVTVEGNPVTFESPFEQDAKSVVVTAKPIQDLHGYDHPWVGGAGKNLWNTDGYLSSVNISSTVVVSKVSENVYHISGTLGSPQWVHFVTNSYAPLTLPSDTYTVSIRNKSTGDYNSSVRFYFNDDSTQRSNYATYTGAITHIRILLLPDYAYNDDITIQIEKGSTPTTFAPYSNICPISGIDDVEIGVSDGESEPTTTTIPLPSTLYGGDVDVTEGSGTENVNCITKDDFIFENGTSGGGLHWVNYPTDNALITDSLCSVLPFSASAWGETTPCYTITENVRVRVYGTFTSLEEFKTQYPDLQIAYKKSTPTTLSLTPTDVELLEGTNVLTTNGEKVAVTYGRSLWQDIDDLKTDTEGKLDKSDVADVEGDTASRAYSVNEFMLRSDGFYRVTQPIAQNASITASNTTKTTIGAVLTALLNA